MAVLLNHTIVHARDSAESANFLSEILGVPPPTRFPPFLVVELANGVSLDFIDEDEGVEVHQEHYAFLVSEAEFDEIFARIVERGIPYFADPAGREPQQINHHFGGRGCYFPDPAGHWLEIITQPYATS
jgi:catechol 2,3-dioxygenase-like lactoylglutathione lyase family enzyme